MSLHLPHIPQTVRIFDCKQKFCIFASGNANRVDWQLLMWTKERRRYEKGIYCCDYFVRCGAGGNDADETRA